MGICIPKKQNISIKSNVTKNAIYNEVNNNKENNKRDTSGCTFIKYLKSLKNFNDIENRLSKLTKYEDINQYYSFSNKKIAKNEMYILYLAKKNDSSKKEFNYIVKKVFKSKNDDKVNISLIKEIKINLMLHHENIVKCYDIFEDDLSVYFVYEYLPKGDLNNYLFKKRNHCLKDKKIISILEQMLLSLIYVHEKMKIIHRDIKPENFLLKKEEKKLIVKLKDFDNAEFIQEEGFKFLTKGTPLYVAPEVYLEKNYDEKIDMWGMGMILYNMITGNNPFNSDKNKKLLKHTKNKKEDLDFTILEEDKILMDKILNYKIDFFIIKHLGLRQLAQGLLERNPNKRYSALEALDELNKIKKGLNLYTSKTMKESPFKFKRIPTVFEEEITKKPSVKFMNKFKNYILNRNETMNDLNNKDGNNENIVNKENFDDTNEFSEIEKTTDDNKNLNHNDIKIVIMKKKK